MPWAWRSQWVRSEWGGFVNGKVTRVAALLGAGVVLLLNMVLIAQT